MEAANMEGLCGPQDSLIGETFPADTINERQREEEQREEAYARIRASRKRKASWKHQKDVFNKPYNTSKFASFTDEVFPKPIVTNPSTEASAKAKVISNTGLLGEYNLELDLDSDSSTSTSTSTSSSSSSSEEAEDRTIMNANALSSTVTNKQYLRRKEKVLRTVRILNALWVKPSVLGIKMDGSYVSVYSTFSADFFMRQLRAAKGSSVANPVWQLGFDHHVLARAARNLPEFLISVHKVVRYLGTCDRNTFKQYIESLDNERTQALERLKEHIEPCRNTEVSIGFKQLAADFFGGREVVEDYAAVDVTQSEFGFMDTPESTAEFGESAKSYKITYQAGDRAKYLHGDALRDVILLTFLLDTMMSREMQEMVEKDTKYRSMKVYHSTERATAMARLNSLELSHSRGESAWWKEKGFKVKILTDGTIQNVDNKAIIITSIGGNSKIGSETKEAPRIMEIDASEIPEEVEESKPEPTPTPTKSKKKKKAKKTKGPAEAEEKSTVMENLVKKSPHTHQELEINSHSEAKGISDAEEDEVKGESGVKEDGNTQPLRNGESDKASIQEVARANLAKSNKKTKAKKVEHTSGIEVTEEQPNTKEEFSAKEDPDGKKDVGIPITKESSNETDEQSDSKAVKGNADIDKVMAILDCKEVENSSGLKEPKKVAISEDTLTDMTPEHDVSPFVPAEQLHQNHIPQEALPKPAKPKSKPKTKTSKADIKDDKKSETVEIATVDSPAVEPSNKDSMPKEAQAKSAKPKNKSKAKEVKEVKEHGKVEDNKKTDTKENGVADVPQSEEVDKVNIQEDAHSEATTPAKKKKRHGWRHRNKRNLDNDATTSALNSTDLQPDHSAETAKSTLDVPLNEDSATAKGYDGSTGADAKTVAKQIDTPTVDGDFKIPIVGNADGNIPIGIPIGLAGTITTPSDVKAETRNPGWKQVKKPKAEPKSKASKNTVSNEGQVLPLPDTGSTTAALNNVVVRKSGHEQVVRSNAESSLPVTITALKVRRDRGQSTSTIVSPAVVDLNTSMLTSDHIADTSALSSVGDVPKVAGIVAEDQQAVPLSFMDMSSVKALNFDQPALEAVGIKGCHHETMEKKAVPGSDLAWADLTTQRKLPARQRLPSLQAKETRFKEAGDPTLKEEAPLQKTRVRDPRVLAIQFGDIPIGFGLELPIGTSREPRLIFPGALPSMAGTNLSFDESKVQTPTKMNDTAPFESPSASSKYYTPSPLYDPAIPVMQSPESQFNGSTAVPPHDMVLESRGSRADSAPYPPPSHPTVSTNEMSGRMYGEQMDPSIGGFSYASQQHNFPVDEEIPSPFTCICCRVTRRPTPQAPVYFCPFCGPLTNVRYCSRACILADAFDHTSHCINYPASQSITIFDPPSSYVYDKDAILSVQSWETPNRALFRQKAFSMYCFSGQFPNICQAWMLKIKNREGIYPAEVDFGKITGDYHIFRSESSATGKFSPTEVLTTFRLSDDDPMKLDFNRVLTTCFMFGKLDRPLVTFLYRLIRHFICHDSYYRYSFPAVPREILWPEFKHQFQQEWSVWYSEHAEPPILELDKEWPLIHHMLLRYEHTYPELVIHLMRKLPFPDQAMPTPLH